MDPERRIYCTYCDDYGHNIVDHKDDGPMCVCGHFEADHHRSWFAVTKYTPNGGMLVEECEYYGHNDTGGMEHADGGWREHCYKFKEAK